MAEGELLRWLDANGIKPLNSLDALNGWQAVVHERVQTIIANVDWARLDSIYQARRQRPLLTHLVRGGEGPAGSNLTTLNEGIGGCPGGSEALNLRWACSTSCWPGLADKSDDD